MRLDVNVRYDALNMRFNPRICKRCDWYFPHQMDWFFVSIHASVKDATTQVARPACEPKVSIHASVKDATQEKNLQA